MGEASEPLQSADIGPRGEGSAAVGRPPDQESLRAAEVIVGLFRRAGRALRASDFDAPGEWAAALTMPQLRVLYLLGRHPSLPVGSVAEAMRISQPSATETIDRLVRAGYVSRTTCTTDRRVVRTALTASGRTLIDRPWEARRALLADALAKATPTQRDAVTRGLETLCDLLADPPASLVDSQAHIAGGSPDAPSATSTHGHHSPPHIDPFASEDRV